MSAPVDNSNLANTVTAIIASLLGGVASGATEAVANQLYSEISRRLRKSARSASAFSDFEANPKSAEAKRKLKQELLAEFKADEAFRQHIGTLINYEQHQTSTTVSVTGSGTAIGRDHISKSTRNNYGGLVVAAVAILAIALVLLIGRGAVNLVQTWSKDAAYGGLSGQSTCKQFIAADPSSQAAIMKKLYLDRDKTQSASDPFIIQNTLSTCGYSPNKLLAQIADDRTR